METYLFQNQNIVVEVNAASYMAAQEIAGKEAVLLASGKEEVAAYDAVN